MTNTTTTIREAIATSICENRTVDVEATPEDVVAAAESYDTDWSEENDGSIDMWGWTDATPESEQEWRLRLI